MHATTTMYIMLHPSQLMNVETGDRKIVPSELAGHGDPIEVVFAQCSTRFQLLQTTWPKIK